MTKLAFKRTNLTSTTSSLNNTFKTAIQTTSNSMECTSLNIDDFRYIEDLGQILELLARFKNLQDLDISENDIYELPEDLSALAEVIALNINGNPLENVRKLGT